MRYLAIDYGSKRTGLAVGDDETRQAGPVGVIESSDVQTVVNAIAKAIDKHDADELVLGLPLNMDGTQGPAALKGRQLAQHLTQHTGLVVHCVDERLSSFDADTLLQNRGLTRKQKKARHDALAAVVILQDFLASRNTPSNHPEPQDNPEHE